ncbi:MAG: hypothetical protein ACRCVN_05360 [Spirochaetia bacterium]
MYLFAILLFPLVVAYQLLNERYFTRPLWELACGVFFSIPCVFILQVLRILIIPINWAYPLQSMILVWIFDFLLPSLLSCYFFLELLRRKLLGSGRIGMLWFCGFFFPFVLVKLIYNHTYYGLYELFYIPIIYICFTVLFPLWLSRRYGNFFWNAFWGTILALWTTVLPMLILTAYYMYYPSLAFISMIVFVTLVANIFFFTYKKAGVVKDEDARL